jgi:hypothetical protein
MEQPALNPDEDMHERGQEAEQFLRFIQDGNQYFLKLMSQLEGELLGRLRSLSPSQRDQFSEVKAQLDGIYEPLHRVHVDIELGKAAWARINGVEDQTQGIL